MSGYLCDKGDYLSVADFLSRVPPTSLAKSVVSCSETMRSLRSRSAVRRQLNGRICWESRSNISLSLGDKEVNY